jgi:hypothetical protein
MRMKKLIGFLALIRAVFIPLSLLCNIQPRNSTNLSVFGDFVFYLITFIGGVTNGYSTTIALMHLPRYLVYQPCVMKYTFD